jgi:hypothetical protein
MQMLEFRSPLQKADYLISSVKSMENDFHKQLDIGKLVKDKLSTPKRQVAIAEVSQLCDCMAAMEGGVTGFLKICQRVTDLSGLKERITRNRIMPYL